nr:hypothetical protein CFP56_67639 [Quercus suber]
MEDRQGRRGDIESSEVLLSWTWNVDYIMSEGRRSRVRKEVCCRAFRQSERSRGAGSGSYKALIHCMRQTRMAVSSETVVSDDRHERECGRAVQHPAEACERWRKERRVVT